MPDGREREQVRGFVLLLWPLNLPEWGAGNGVVVVSLHSAALFACIPAGREGNYALHSSFVPSAISCFGAGAGIGGFGGSLPSAAALLVRKPAEMKAGAKHFRIFAPPPFSSHGLDRWRGRGVNVSLTSGTALLVCMSADPEGERAGHLFILRFCRSISTDWVEGRERVSVTLTLSGGSFSMHASGSGG